MNSHKLNRRGFELGSVAADYGNENKDDVSNWNRGQPSLVRQACAGSLSDYGKQIKHAKALYQAILTGAECDPLMDEEPYRGRLASHFEPLGSSVSEGEQQEIETLFFDGLEDGELVAEDLWMKISWLSFIKGDASLRFRFSFGVDFEEDVAADAERQHYAAMLCDAVFPESELITGNTELAATLKGILKSEELQFVERIVYFNSPGGGAYLHHDRERGHAGVVYAQLTGSTFWIALPRATLCEEIIRFVDRAQADESWPESITSEMQSELIMLAKSPDNLAEELETFANNSLIHLINETEPFVQQLIRNGHGRLVHSGDAMLLPQEDENNCCWHSVFCIGDEAGEALSFAIRRG